METINVRLVEAKINKQERYFRKYLRIENYNSFELISLPDLGQISFFKEDYRKCIEKGDMIVKDCVDQPQITYMV